MNDYRPLRVLLLALLAMVFMGGGAMAHGPVPHASYGAQAAQAGTSADDRSAFSSAPQVEWANSSDHHSASSDCSDEASGECCSHHCCTGTPAVSETRSPALVTGTRLAQLPPDAPRDQTLSGLLRPPCR